MGYSLCSYSLHNTFDAGKMDIFGYIRFCKEAGFTQLDPWMHHLKEGFDDNEFLVDVKIAGQEAGLPFGCIAVDGAHIYEPTIEARTANRQRAYRWMQIANFLGANQVRIDAGGHDETMDEILDVVVSGYHDIIAHAQALGLEVLIENHWGPTQHPDNLYRLLDAVPDLGLLFDSYNWPEGTHMVAWRQYARYARMTHFKTFSFDADGNDPEQDIPLAISLLQDASYDGCWGIESCPNDGDEINGAVKTLALLRRILE